MLFGMFLEQMTCVTYLASEIHIEVNLRSKLGTQITSSNPNITEQNDFRRQ